MRAREFIREGKSRPNVEIRWDGNFTVKAYVDGKFAGSAEFASDDPEGRYGFYAIDVGVLPQYRRMGVATAMYDAAAEKFGEIIPSEHQTDDARAFWKSYGREVVGENLSNSQVLKYVKKIHPDWSGSVDHSIMNHEEWELINYPVSQLKIADPESEDGYIEDPYNRILDVDMAHVQSIKQHDIKNKPIVVDTDGYIIDGNHRAMAAKLSGMNYIPAYVPYEEITESLSISTQKQGKKFATRMTLDGTPIGSYEYDARTGRSLAEVLPEYQGKGYGKILVLHAIYTAGGLIEDESRTAAYNNVLDSLWSEGLIVEDDGYWYCTEAGEEYLDNALKNTA